MQFRSILQIAAAGGIASVFGTTLIQYVLANIVMPTRSPSVFQGADGLVWAILAFISGVIIGGGTAALWSRPHRVGDVANGRWPKRGLFFGMVAGLANVALLTIFHLCLLFLPAASRGEMTIVALISLVATYALAALVVFGIPALVLGGLLGAIIETIQRRNSTVA